METFINVVLSLLIFVAVFGLIGGFSLLGIDFFTPWGQSYIHGSINRDTYAFQTLDESNTQGVAVLRNRVACTKFKLEVTFDYPVDVTVFYYDADGKPIAMTEVSDEFLEMNYQDMPALAKSVRIEVRRTDGGAFSDADLLFLSSKVKFSISTKAQPFYLKWFAKQNEIKFTWITSDSSGDVNSGSSYDPSGAEDVWEFGSPDASDDDPWDVSGADDAWQGFLPGIGQL